MKYDVKRREYDVVVIGEEPHLAYNRVGLTSFFQHRQVENLYLNPREWVSRREKERENSLFDAFLSSRIVEDNKFLSTPACPKAPSTTTSTPK